MLLRLVVVLLAGVGVSLVLARGFSLQEPAREKLPTPAAEADAPPKDESRLATFGNGCFWCTEAVFKQLKGVEKVVSGYSGGEVPNPSYEAVCTGTTGHAEVIQITFDPEVITYPELLQVFWETHDPTTKNRQGPDVGTQYRSVVFTHSERQRELAEGYKRKIDQAGIFKTPIVTEITPFKEFFPAEELHQDYFARNPDSRYCQVMIGPKLEKLKKIFAEKLKPAAKP